MSLLEFIDYIVVLPVVIKLLFELLDSLFKLLLGVHDLEAHLGDLVLVVFLDLPLPVLDLGLVLLELLLRFLPLSRVSLLHVPDHSFYVRLFPRLLESVFLSGDDRVGFSENRLDFFFVSTRK